MKDVRERELLEAGYHNSSWVFWVWIFYIAVNLIRLQLELVQLSQRLQVYQEPQVAFFADSQFRSNLDYLDSPDEMPHTKSLQVHLSLVLSAAVLK